MISKSTWLHLRIPFSIFLMPVFLFAVSQSDKVAISSIILSFIALHIFIYPASNGFNSFYDKDEDSIGGLKIPPKVDQSLLWASLIFDCIGIILGLLISLEFAFGLLLYGLISKAYSHPSIRLKKYPFLGLITVGLFQGAFVYLICIQAFMNIDYLKLLEFQYLFPALITSVLLLGSYPMTQIYQHAEDSRRGDNTLSLKLGIRGTFIFTALIFLMADILFGIYFYIESVLYQFYIFQVFLIPVLIYFQYWMFKAWNKPQEANFERTMKLNKTSSISMILFFILIAYLNA